MAKAATKKNKKPEKPVTLQDAAPTAEKKEPTIEEQITMLQKGFVDQTELVELLYNRQVKFEQYALKRFKVHHQALRFTMYAILALAITDLIISQTCTTKRYYL